MKKSEQTKFNDIPVFHQEIWATVFKKQLKLKYWTDQNVLTCLTKLNPRVEITYTDNEVTGSKMTKETKSEIENYLKSID